MTDLELAIHTLELAQRRLSEAERERLTRRAAGRRRPVGPRLAAALMALTAHLDPRPVVMPATAREAWR
jgi:hypothetical protein